MMLWKEGRLYVFLPLSLSLSLPVHFGWSPRRRRAALLITYENGARHLYSDNDRPTERTDQERRDELTGCGALRGLSILLCQIPV